MMSGNEPKCVGTSLQNRVDVQVKVCGLTRVEEAVACAQAGARAVGCVFYAKSPRCVTAATARAIRRALPPEVACVGVFVDEPFDGIMALAAHTGFTAVQLHGSEAPEVVERLRREGLFVIKALFADRAPGIREPHRSIRLRPTSWSADGGRCPVETPTPGNGAAPLPSANAIP